MMLSFSREVNMEKQKICPTHAIKTTGMSLKIILTYLFIETSAN